MRGLWALAASGRANVIVATGPLASERIGRNAIEAKLPFRLAGETASALADDVALDLVGSRPDRAGLVVEPRPLPRAVARILRGAAPQRCRLPEHRHRGVV